VEQKRSEGCERKMVGLTRNNRSPNHMGAIFSKVSTSLALPSSLISARYWSASPPLSGLSSWMIIVVCGGGFSTGVSIGKLGVIPCGSGWSGFCSICSSYSRRIFCTTPKKLSSMLGSFSASLSEERIDAVSEDFSSVVTGALTSAEDRVVIFLGKDMPMPNFLPNKPFFFSSVGDVGVDTVASFSAPMPGVLGTLSLSEEVSDWLLVILFADGEK
jgi:hypothetical protein